MDGRTDVRRRATPSSNRTLLDREKCRRGPSAAVAGVLAKGAIPYPLNFRLSKNFPFVGKSSFKI